MQEVQEEDDVGERDAHAPDHEQLQVRRLRVALGRARRHVAQHDARHEQHDRQQPYRVPEVAVHVRA